MVPASISLMGPVLSLAGLLLSVARSAQAADSQRVYAEDQLTVAPVVLRQPTVYPDSLKRRGIGGTVGVSVVLDRKGHPDFGSVRVVSTPDSALNEPARAVVLGSHFAPGRVEDRAVRAQVVVEVAFDPLDTATAPSPIYEEEDSLSHKPALLFGPPIVYPEDLQRNRIQGRVVVQVILDTLGRVERGSIQFVATPHVGFLMSVSQYLGLARFRPARRNGRLVRSLVYMPVDFRLRGLAFPCPVVGDLHLKCPP
jgi:TonB family protein